MNTVVELLKRRQKREWLSRRTWGFIVAGATNTIGVTSTALSLEPLPFISPQLALLIAQLVWLVLGARLYAYLMFGLRRLALIDYVKYARNNAFSFLIIQILTPVLARGVGLNLGISILLAALVGTSVKYLLIRFSTFRQLEFVNDRGNHL